MDVLEEGRRLVALWRPRLGISEVVNIEAIADDQLTEREREGQCLPIERDSEGLWEFTVQLVETLEAERIERVTVHELVHVIMEPLRERYLKSIGDDEHPSYIVRGMSGSEGVERLADVTGQGMVIALPESGSIERLFPDGRVETWETVIDRLADAYLRAYEG